MLLSVFVATLLSGSPIPTATPGPLPSVSLPPELARVLTEYEQAWQARDAAGLASLFTDDGFVLSGGHAPVRGRRSIQQFYSGHGGPLSLRALHYAAEGSVAFIIGAYAGKVGDPDDGKFTLTLRRETSGRWRIVSDMDNGNRASRPSAP